MKKPKYETFENDILKADLMLSDYTLATDPEEKKIYLDLLDRYIVKLDEANLTAIYNRMATVTNDAERNIYVDLLADLLADRKSEILGGVA